MEESGNYQVETSAQETVTTPVIETQETLGDSGLKALEAERKRAKELERQLKQFKGIDPSQYQELLALKQKWEAEQKEQELKTLEAQQKYEEALKLTKEQELQERLKIQQEAEKYKQELEQTRLNYQKERIESQFATALADSGCIKPSLMIKEFGDKLTIEDGQVKVLDVAGNPTNQSLKEFIESVVKPENEFCFKSNLANGTGLTPGSGGSKPIVNGMSAEDFLKLSSNQQFELANKQQKL